MIKMKNIKYTCIVILLVSFQAFSSRVLINRPFVSRDKPPSSIVDSKESKRLVQLFDTAFKKGMFQSEQTSIINPESEKCPNTSSFEAIDALKKKIPLDYLQKNAHQEHERLLSQLDVTLPIDEIEKVFEKTNAIKIRELKTEKLVIGCGWNNSSHSNRCPHHFNAPERDEFDTINLDARFNPSVVGFWGDPKLAHLFAQKKFSTLIDEGPVLAFIGDKDSYWQSARDALIPGGKILIPLHVLEGVKIPDDFKREKEDDTSSTNSYHPSAVFIFNPGIVKK